MIYYEMLMLLRPDISQDSYDEIKGKIEASINENTGVLKSYDKWGKYLLSYEINKFSYGIYVLIRFGIKKENAFNLIEKLITLCKIKFNSTVMRNVIVSLGEKYNENYCRPDSLEEAPRRDKGFEEKWGNNSEKRFDDDSSRFSGKSNLDLDVLRDDIIINESAN